MSSSSPKSDSSNLIRPEWGLGQVNNDGYGYNILNQVGEFKHFLAFKVYQIKKCFYKENIVE